MVLKINFSQVAKISCRLVQKWPRYKKKPQKWTLKNDFSEKSPRILNFWKKFLNPHIKPFSRCISTNWEINFVSTCHPAHCALQKGSSIELYATEIILNSSAIAWQLYCLAFSSGLASTQKRGRDGFERLRCSNPS